MKKTSCLCSSFILPPSSLIKFMPTYYDSQNNAHDLTERLGSGGEGTVYSCADFNLVAKIYHEPVTAEKAEKLDWMAANKPERLLKIAAWVIDVLRDAPDGQVVGFLMPNVKAKEIHELYSLKSRRVHFPEATWHFLVHTAANVARAFYNLHGANHIMGDVNHGNCVVLADGTVKLIDCDSYSVKTDKMRYRCEVGVGTHLAPELQRANLRDVERLEKHDNFGLAVIIFQLLFLGRHPFAGNYLGAEDKSIEECIRELRFAYGDGATHRMVKQPPGTLPLAAVSPRVALMFERAFLTEDRPEPREWIEALEDLSANLEQCGTHPGHLYFAKLAQCPWCEIEAQTGLMLFPFITAGSHLNGEKPFNIFTVETLIANLGITQTLQPAKPPSPLLAVLPPPTDDVVKAKRENQKLTVISLTVQFFAMVFLMLIIGIGTSLFFGILMLIFWLIYTNNSIKYVREDLDESLNDARLQWETLESGWMQKSIPPQLTDDLKRIKEKVGDYQEFQQSNARQVKALREENSRQQFQEYLRSVPLADASDIYGITAPQRQNLIEKGIKTAADVQEHRIRDFHNFNGEVVPKLLDWRKRVERKFAPDETDFKKKEAELINDKSINRRQIEKEIESLLVALRSGAVNLRRHQQQLSANAAELAARLGQTQSNANFLGTNAPAIIGLLLITFLTPYLGFIVSQINTPRLTVTKPTSSSGTGYGSATGTTSYRKPNLDALEVPDENITDSEIAALGDNRRKTYANNLNLQATDKIYSENPDYPAGERKIRLMMRLDGESVGYLDQLGYALYMQERYDESLKYLNRSLKQNAADYTARMYSGLNYLKLKRFSDARKIFAEITKEDAASTDDFYNLGLANIGLKNYEAAATALQNAVALGKDDADAHYQLGICYYKTGNPDGVRREYETLLRLNKIKAENLKRETNLGVIVSVDESN